MPGLPIAIAASSCAIPRGLAPADDLWELLLAGNSLLRPRPHLGLSAPACTFDPGFAGHSATALAFAALRGVWAKFVATPGRAAWLLASAKGELEDWLSDPARPPGLDALESALADLAPGLPAWRRTVSNACVSSAQAVIEAAELLQDGDADRALVLGADGLSPFVAQGFHALKGVSPTGARPFDANRDGLSLGEAGAACLLVPADRAPAAPRLAGWGASNDANHISGPSRDGSGLALAIERALEGLDRSRVVAICGHGTGTVYNDAMEARAFHAAFGPRVPPVFGIKGSIGHTLGAAGLIELAVSARVAGTGLIPPTAGFARGDMDFALDVVHGRPRQAAPGLVLTTNSGFGGMNTAIVVAPGEG